MKPGKKLAKRVQRLEDKHRRDMVTLKAEILRAVHYIVEENRVEEPR